MQHAHIGVRDTFLGVPLVNGHLKSTNNGATSPPMQSRRVLVQYGTGPVLVAWQNALHLQSLSLPWVDSTPM
jgi:hypothetical protein